MPDDKGINVPITLDVKSVKGIDKLNKESGVDYERIRSMNTRSKILSKITSADSKGKQKDSSSRYKGSSSSVKLDSSLIKRLSPSEVRRNAEFDSISEIISKASSQLVDVFGGIDEGYFRLRKNQFPKRESASEYRRDSEWYSSQASYFDMIGKLTGLLQVAKNIEGKLKLQDNKHTNDMAMEAAKRAGKEELLARTDIAKKEADERRQRLEETRERREKRKQDSAKEVEEIKARNRRSLKDKEHHLRLREMIRKKQIDIELIDARSFARMRVDNNRYQNMWDLALKKDMLQKQKEEERFNSQFGMEGLYNKLRNGLARVGLPLDDLRHLWLARTGKASILPKRMDAIKGNLKAFGIGTAITAGVTAATFLIKKTLTTLVSTSKKIVGFFINAAKQAETFKNMMNLALAPIITMFTLLFVPLLIAIVPLIKTMFDWVLSNKDAIMAVGEKLGSVFNAENLAIVGKALDGILFVLDALANIFANNASMIDTSSLDRFISSTVLAISNMIQDILLSIIAFCYSPEGQAFIKSISYSVGEIIGSIFTTIVALLPVIVESVFYSILGLINGIWSMISKAIFNLFDVVDKFTGGAISGFLNTIVNLINTAINALNSINIFGFSPFNIPTLNGGTVGQIGSSVNNFVDQSIVNNFNVNNAMRVSNPSVLKDVMSTGVY